MSILQELRRRKVFRLAALYIVGAWVVLQVADLAFESWDISSSALRYVWFSAIFGFPIALIFGWRYDITTQGIVRTPPTDAITQTDLSLRRSDYVILALLMIVAIGVIYPVTIQISNSRSAQPAEITRRDIEPNSIAVLPFDNLSGDPDQAYFVSGMQDALIAGLSRISALRVTSKTSTSRFADTVESLPIIAEQLGVAKLIEGSIFRVGSHVRITINLVDARLDEHIWSETFENEIKDVLVLQSNVAQAIAQQVEVTITPAEQAHLRNVKSVNPEAYEVFLKARLMYLESSNDPEKAIETAKRVIELDPGFAPGYAFLSDLYGYLILMHHSTSSDVHLQARILAQKAIELDPENPDARFALARVHYRFEWDWAAAEAEFKRGLELDPNSASGLNAYGAFRVLIYKDCDEGLAMLEAARDRDPFNPGKHLDLGLFNFSCRNMDESIKHLEQTIEMVPELYWARLTIALAHFLDGSIKLAAEGCDSLIDEVGQHFESGLLGSCAWIYFSAGQEDLAQQILERLRDPPAGNLVDPVVLSWACFGLGDLECGFHQLEEALRQQSSLLIFMRTAPVYDPFRKDPRFLAIVNKMNFPP